MGAGPSRSSQSTSGPVDVRSTTERARDDKAAALQSGMLDRPDLGYEDQSGTRQAQIALEQDRYQQGVIGTTSDLGFSPQKSGVAASVIGRGQAAISAREQARQGEEFTNWRQWMLGGSRAGQSAQGQAQQSQSTARSSSGSPWAGAARGAGGVIGGLAGAPSKPWMFGI